MDRGRRASFSLYLITDRKVHEARGLIEMCDSVLAAAPPGTVALQLREKDLGGCDLYELACRLREICTRAGAMLLINDRIDVAIASDADGVHLPADSVGAVAARKLLGAGRLIGVSTHSRDELAAAGRDGADFAVFGPVFDPISKSGGLPACGPDGLLDACRECAMPVFALGGITPERARELFARGGRAGRPAGVAAIGSIFGAKSPPEALRAMLAAIGIGSAGAAGSLTR
ncbi:MAG TPA: thiamine phosphate synthase [Candidatus Binataceae bacterium]|nr:thiamine phosphate synthase [Candidatus Binataceae bacterium]